MTALLLAVLLVNNVQDADTRALLRLEDEWASALVTRDSGVFNRLLAPGFVYTENDQMMDRAAVLHSVVPIGRFSELTGLTKCMFVLRAGPGGGAAHDCWPERGLHL